MVKMIIKFHLNPEMLWRLSLSISVTMGSTWSCMVLMARGPRCGHTSDTRLLIHSARSVWGNWTQAGSLTRA